MTRRLGAWWLVPALLFCCVTIPKLWQADFRSDAGWYSAIGVQAWRTGHLWTLYGEPGQPYFNKPPLVFWIHGLVMHIFGVGPLQSRLPTVLAGVLCVLATMRLVTRINGRRAGWWAGTVLALSYDFFSRGRDVSLDMWQTMFMVVSLACVLDGDMRERRSWFALAGVPLGLALLCKPLTALLVIPMMVAWLLISGRASKWWWPLLTTFAAVAVAAPWHVSMYLLHGQNFTSQYFGAEIVGRATGAIADTTKAGNSWWFHISHIVQRYWPWLPFAGAGAIAVVQMWRRNKRHSAAMFAVIWSIAWLILLSVFTDRRDRYSLPLYPGLAWLAAIGIAGSRVAWVRIVQRRAAKFIGPVMAVCAIVISVIPLRVHKPEPQQWARLFDWVRQNKVAGEPVARDGGNVLWQGAFQPLRGARLYLEFGWWPRTTRDRWGNVLERPGPGSLVIYHRRDGLAPGERETVVFAEGDLKVTSLQGEWKPIEVPDPGE